jgi:hypothetical protein
MRIAGIFFYILIAFLALGIFVETSDAASVYYSVGQNTSDHKTGTPTVDITGGTANFSTPQTATNMGVGDKVTYGGSTVAYISSKIATNQWTLVTATGGTPPDVTGQTVNSITHAFDSLSAAITGASDADHLNTTDLAGGNYILNIPCYYDSGSDTADVTISGYTTGASNYIKIYTPNNTSTEVNQSQRHNGMWSSTAYNITHTPFASNYFIISNSHVKVIGLQIFGANLGGDANTILVLGGAYSGIEISSSIIRGAGNTAAGTNNGIHIASNTDGSTIKLYNNLIYDQKNRAIFANYTDGSTIYVYNCTIIGPSAGTNTGIDSLGENTFIVKNTIVQGWTDGFSGTFDASSTNNISDRADDAPGSNAKNSTTVLFMNSASGNYHLSSLDSAAKNAGVDLSADANVPFNYDIDGQTRTGTWDIGADEYVVEGSTPNAKVFTIGSGVQIKVLP